MSAGSPSLLWSLNARAVLEAVHELAPVARPEITRATGLSKTAVSQTLSELERRGLVVNAGLDDTRRGPVATLYALNDGYALGAAVDIGHRYIRAVVVGLTGTVIARAQVAADHSTPDATAAAVASVIESCAPLTTLSHAVIGVAAAAGDSGLRLASGLAADGAGLPEALRAALPFPIDLENDTNLAALAERAVRDLDDFALLSVGSSIGAGIVIGGRVHRGARGSAGEVNYLPSRDDNVDDTLGSESVIADAHAEGLAGLTPKQLFDHARFGDPAALHVVDRTAQRLARVIAALALVLDPEYVILGGSIGSNGDLLLDPVERYLLARYPEAALPLLAAIAGDDAVLDGATSLIAARLRDAAFDVVP